jgi:predicted RNase H-like HicB family nuclease
MTEVFFVVEEALEGGFTAKALGESIFTEAETLEELRVNVKEAVECHFDTATIPE